MNFIFDVAIVGGGPIGSTLAYEIVKNGFSVCIIEKKRDIGMPLQCAGIVSKRLTKLNDIPNNLILNKVKGAFLHSPNYDLKVEKNNVEAFIIDRVGYDKFLSKRAIDAGVHLFSCCKVKHIDAEKGIIHYKDKKIVAKVIVGADGSKSTVSNLFNKEFNYFNGSQYLIKVNNLNSITDEIRNRNESENKKNNNEIPNSFNNDFVDLYLNSIILPGFIWSIPISNNMFRVGLFSKNSYKEQNNIINEFLNNNSKFKKYNVIEKYYGNIPIYDKNKKLVNKRIILIGDAASQLKPTTGGGIIIGFDTCGIAKKSIEKALKNDDMDFLKEYEDNFRKKYSKELSYQIKFQKTIENLSNDDLDYMFLKLKEKNAEEIISKYGDMDKQSILVKEFIKRGLIFSVLPKMVLFRNISTILDLV